MKRLAILIGLILFTAIFIAVGWYLVTPLFFDRAINEESPYTFPADGEIGRIMPPAAPPTGTKAEQTARRIIPPPPDGTLAARAIVAGMEEAQAAQITVEPQPEAIKIANPQNLSPSIVYQGAFVDGDAFHKGSGNATIFAETDGSYLLRFEHFKTTNGPDVHVLLSPHASPSDFTQLGDYLDLGSLKGNVGDQMYTLPADFDPTLYKSVVIYCQPFRVIFATATLE